MGDVLTIGQIASIKRVVTDETVRNIAAYSGDTNPVHLDEEYAARTIFQKRIAHGLFCLGMVSSIIGTVLPGKGSILMNENINYRRPVYIGDEITTKVTVVEILPKDKYMMSFECTNQDEMVVIDGTTLVKVI